DTLCIPTAFCSYGGEALDKKTPLLRSMEAINRQGMRVLRLFGNGDAGFVKTTCGPEQEYFLIDEDVFLRRPDLVYTGRTLFGAKPPKGQELGDHYYGMIKPRVAAFMAELDEELWKLGILAKTEHNEVAPAQHELAPVFMTTNIAADHNQITMELMQKIAKKHGMVCLLHEKPFAGVNGSGKHNNWSMTTGTGANLLEPGETPYENAQFLLMLCAVIQAVDDYQDMLRLSITSASNDLRLGADEAPPAVISVYVGEELEDILNAIERGEPYGGKEKELIKVGVHALPKLPKDTTDRNRTSPFAFTGNKFEFRMPGSSSSISGANVVINTAVAESLRQYANELELSDNFENDLHELIRRVIRKHKRIIFNGNGYGEEWLKEAERRGLLNLRTTPDCAHAYLEQKNVELFIRHSVYSEIELAARYKMKLDNYCKVLRIEAETMLHMLRRDILPSVSAYSAELANAAISKQELGIECSFEKDGAAHISRLISSCCDLARELDAAIADVSALPENYTRAVAGRDRLIPPMTRLRSLVDELEVHTSAEYWPMPTYGEILFSVN
ncbi:MAG: glutamine synthetase III, partial [Clostridia bacterium]|nr:glutamine synthetase III [Clostridia bacterium]